MHSLVIGVHMSPVACLLETVYEYFSKWDVNMYVLINVVNTYFQ